MYFEYIYCTKVILLSVETVTKKLFLVPQMLEMRSVDNSVSTFNIQLM